MLGAENKHLSYNTSGRSHLIKLILSSTCSTETPFSSAFAIVRK